MDQEKVNNKKTPKSQYILVAGLFIVAIGLIFLSMNLFNGEEPEQTAKLQQSPETQQSSDPQQLEVSQQVENAVTFRKFDDRTVEITKYELFNRGNQFYSKEAAEFFSLYNTIEKYALFHHLEQYDYQWDDETREKFRERVINALEYDKKDSNLKAYYEKMFNELQITEEEYIEYYLIVNKEYEMFYDDLFNKRIVLDETGSYPSGEAEMAYRKLIGITEEYLNELAEEMPEPLEPMEPQPDLPFLTQDSRLKVTTNAKGEYIFVETMYFFTDLDDPYIYLLFELETKFVKEEPSRYSVKKYQDAVATYESDDARKMETVKELGLIFEILERTLEMESI